jgi:tight adherence protein B
MKNVLIGIAALAVVALFEGLYYAFTFVSQRRQEDLNRRLRPGSAEDPQASLLRSRRLAANPLVESFLEGLPFTGAVVRLLDQAQVDGTVARQLGLSALLALMGAAAGVMLGNLPAAALLSVVGGALPFLRLLLARARCARLLSEQLPNALDMMARSLRAGHALPNAFKLVASEMPGPINLEFARATEQLNLGARFDLAVQAMTDRVPSNNDLKIFAVSVIVQRETGGNLVEILEKLAQTIRGRYQFYGKVAALTGEGRLSGLVLGGLPLVTSTVLMFVNPTYMSQLVTEPLGRLILAYVVVSWLFGIVCLRQMSKVAV